MRTLAVPEAVDVLESGGILIFPTDTAFGIGCAIDNIDAVERLFRIRQRPTTQATPVLVGGIEMAQEYLKPIPEKVREKLMDQHWPGALTVILPAISEKIPSFVRGGTETLGVRMPKNDVALDIINGLGKPILGPSANFHGQQTPYTFESVDTGLISQVDGIVRGECSLKRESTVINASVTPWEIVRQGAVNISSEIV